ncbi:unnamed protein product [Linum tenue]|uniref:Uncharacterized protein n=1 Tax=Linum tenue TaxID=586396 RepID=A0AAV0NIH6_9ROSI|nr:unnamed protein product [Linum tenue]
MESAMELADECLPRIWEHTSGYISTMAVKCAVELEIPDLVHRHGARPITLLELASSLVIPPAKAPFLSRLMRALVHLGYFLEDDQGRYSLAPLSRLLLKENPLSARSALLLGSDPVMMDPWRHMSTWFRAAGVEEEEEQQQQQTPFALAHGGRKLYQVAAEDPRFARLLNEGVGSDSELFGRVLAGKCQKAFQGLTSLVDVGGNTGNTARVLADAFPGIEFTVFDLPHVVAGLKPTQENLCYWVLIDWGDESCVELLKQCKKAVTTSGGKAAGGKVMIADHVLGHESCNDHSSTTALLYTDLVMMSCFEGAIRSEQQWSKLFTEAGFSNYTITPVGGLRVLIEVYP